MHAGCDTPAPEPVAFEAEMVVEELKRCKSRVTDQITAKLFQAAGRASRFDMLRLASSVRNKAELRKRWKGIVVPVYKTTNKHVQNVIIQ
jgi:hypothetical protein